MGMFNGKCDHQSVSPFKARCTKERGHGGMHGARGLRWAADGKIMLGAKKSGKK